MYTGSVRVFVQYSNYRKCPWVEFIDYGPFRKWDIIIGSLYNRITEVQVISVGPKYC